MIRAKTVKPRYNGLLTSRNFSMAKWALCLCLLTPLLAQAWWNDDWPSRRSIAVDTSATGADLHAAVDNFPLLIRLHAGNFGYFAELSENGRDLRFLVDDKQALPHEAEQLDILNEIGLVWVKLPHLQGGIIEPPIWMYYGNANAVGGPDGSNLYDTAQALVYHFHEGEALPRDSTAYANHAFQSTAQITQGWIGAAAHFDGSGVIRVKPAPVLAINPSQGWTFSVWLKIEQPQASAMLLEAKQNTVGLSLSLQGANLVANWQNQSGQIQAAPSAVLAPGRWQHIAAVVSADRLQIYLDGELAGTAAIDTAGIDPDILIGTQFNGELDEVQIAVTARSADWIKLSYRSQSPDFNVLSFGQDESNSSGDNHFIVILQNVTTDGWVIIGLTGVMLIVALLVIVSKTVTINRAKKANQAFLDYYRQFNTKLPVISTPAEDDEFQNSPLFKIYRLALDELDRIGMEQHVLFHEETWDYLKVKLDARVLSESQAFNQNMVLLTIAIAGGPFLGLLGTVVGVMITFATIAATGDVNINAIAPGIAAALLATVAGLAVAIPALFAYNYLLVQIKALQAGMRVFTDEFLALMAMRRSHQHSTSP